ncbi:MAG: hypothetical protein Q9191_006434 [Dirinaria sp. TL-2023a]
MHLTLASLFTTTLTLASALSIQPRGDTRKRAAYTLSNDASGANLLALSISVEDGTVSNPTLTPTGGKGLLGKKSANASAGPDGLFGQGAVTVSQDVSLTFSRVSRPNPCPRDTVHTAFANSTQYLFTVNAGSNTLSMFRINPLDPLHPKLVGEPCPTLGDFPMSVTYSPYLKTACVLNGGAKPGVTCFHADHAKGLSLVGGLRPLPVVRQTTPPLGPPLTTSDIVFNPSSSALFVSIKGDAGATPPQSGYIYAWPVDKYGAVSDKPVVNQLSVLKMDFSISFLGCDTSALITDPSFGASIVGIAYPSLQITEKHHIVVPHQGAACWSAYAPRFDSAYIIDAAHPNITAVDPVSGAIKGVIKYDASAKGGFDTAVGRTWMYTLTADSSVQVIDLEGMNSGKESVPVQKFSLAKEGPVGAWQGMAIYPS